MTTPILTCTNCGATKPEPDGTPTDLSPSAHCGNCPPWTCNTCGETCSAAALCSCWQTFDDMTIADIKAVFAADADNAPDGQSVFDVAPVINPAKEA